MRQSVFAPYIKEESMPGSEVTSDKDIQAYARTSSKTDYHPVGTCRMGKENNPAAVVTPDLRVKGTEGLRIIDASIMPSVTSSNTSAPTIMIAEKGADMVLASGLIRCLVSSYRQKTIT